MIPYDITLDRFIYHEFLSYVKLSLYWWAFCGLADMGQTQSNIFINYLQGFFMVEATKSSSDTKYA